MPHLIDLGTVRTLLDRERDWAAYAIGDLAPGFLEHCEWHTPPDAQSALLLLYRGYDPPIVFAMGEPNELRALFAELDAPQLSLHIRPEALEAMSGRYVANDTRTMTRMTLRRERFTPVAPVDACPLTEEHLAAIDALYADGHRRGEGPTFFSAAMLRQGTFHGIWEDDALVAIAGTHLYSAELGVSAIGNVYTRSDRRGRGLAARVTSAVATHALNQGVATIVLNVGQHNTVARRVYERLGFTAYCDFLEGEATRIIGA